MKIGIVDLGTLSLRFDIYPSGSDEPEIRHRAMPRLGDLVFRDGRLGTVGRDRLLGELESIRALAIEHGVERLAAVGTSVFREASDGMQIVDEAGRLSGIEIQILTGHEEAELTAEGIIAREPNLPPSFVCVDIGGGSTELSWAEDGTRKYSTSVELGVIRLRERYLPDYIDGDSPISDQTLSEACAAARAALEPLAPQLATYSPSELIGSSGTIRALERLGFAAPETQFCGTVSELERLSRRLLTLVPDELRAIPGVERGRADVLLPGMIILRELAACLGVSSVRVSHYSLRHGILDLTRTGSHRIRWSTPRR